MTRHGLPTRPRLAIYVAVLLVAVGGLIGGLSAQFGDANYTSTGSVILRFNPGGEPDRYVANQLAIATSRDTYLDAANAIGRNLSEVTDSIKVTQVRLSDVLQFTATTDDRAAAVEIVTAVQNAYLDNSVTTATNQPSTGFPRVLQQASPAVRAGLGVLVSAAIGALAGLVLGAALGIVAARRRAMVGSSSVDERPIAESSAPQDQPESGTAVRRSRSSRQYPDRTQTHR